jgi:hypothetical protein
MQNALQDEDGKIRALRIGKQRCENQDPHQVRYNSLKAATAKSKVRPVNTWPAAFCLYRVFAEAGK